MVFAAKQLDKLDADKSLINMAIGMVAVAVALIIFAKAVERMGRIEIQFDCNEFFADIAALIDLPDENEDNVAEYAAMKFMSQHGLNPPT